MADSNSLLNEFPDSSQVSKLIEGLIRKSLPGWRLIFSFVSRTDEISWTLFEFVLFACNTKWITSCASNRNSVKK